MHHASPPSLIALDWGTSSLRAYLMGRDGALLERRAEPWGIQRLPEGGFVAAFRGIAGDWRDALPALPVLAAGMVGSRQGWREVPYVECPADSAAIAAGIVAHDAGCGTLHIVPGMMQRGKLPDVMRGEETQIIGGLTLEPELADASLFVLPGTHCKWATLRDGHVIGFTTYITGELFATLRDHSILGRPAKEVFMSPAEAAAAVTDAAFHRGLETARDSGAEGMAGRLFATRALFLDGQLTAPQTLDYLSGLLIGEEIRSVIAGLQQRPCPPLVLLGDERLCERYRVALAEFGIDRVRVFGETGPAGLWQIASAARLLA
jgi:2-dehydro-3-deoxygalactonokinase